MSDSSMSGVPVVPSGAPELDLVVGDGFPGDKLTGVRGPEHSGKRTVGYTTIATAQARGLECALIQGGGKVDRRYAEAIGVRLGDLHMPQLERLDPQYVLQLAEQVVRSTKDLRLLVIDRLPWPGVGHAPIPAPLIDALVTALEQEGVACLYTIQAPRRYRVSGLHLPGTRRLSHRSAVCLETYRCSRPHHGRATTVNHVHIKVVKIERGNGLAEPRLPAVLDIDTAGGVVSGWLPPETLVRIGFLRGLFGGNPRSLRFRGEEIGNRADAVTRVGEDEDLADQIDAALRDQLRRRLANSQ